MRNHVHADYTTEGMHESDIDGLVTGDDIDAHYEEQVRLDGLTTEELEAEIEATFADMEAHNDKENAEREAYVYPDGTIGFEDGPVLGFGILLD